MEQLDLTLASFPNSSIFLFFILVSKVRRSFLSCRFILLGFDPAMKTLCKSSNDTPHDGPSGALLQKHVAKSHVEMTTPRAEIQRHIIEDSL